MLHRTRICSGNHWSLQQHTAFTLSLLQTGIRSLVGHTRSFPAVLARAGIGMEMGAVSSDLTWGGVTLNPLTRPLICSGALCRSLEQDRRLPQVQRAPQGAVMVGTHLLGPVGTDSYRASASSTRCRQPLAELCVFHGCQPQPAVSSVSFKQIMRMKCSR